MRADRRIACALSLAAGVALFAGCRAKEAPKAVVQQEKHGPALPTGVLLYTSQGRLWQFKRGEPPEAVATGNVWFPSVNREGNLAAYWDDGGAQMALNVLNLVSHTVVRIGAWNSLGSLGRNLNLRNAADWIIGREALRFADGRQIWEVEADGTNLSTLYEHPDGACYAVSNSPDGHRVAFVSATEHDQNLWVYSLETHKAVALTDYTQRDGSVGAPAWSPKGDRIVYVLYKAEEANLWSIPAEGGTPTAMTKEGRTNAPSWDPTGRRLAVSTGTQNPFNWQIALVNGDDGKFIEQLTNVTAGAAAPALSGQW
jgi:WD40 repeat protein